MTKLFALLVLYKGENSAHILKAAYDLASFGYFQRSSIQEFISFTSKILTERTTIGKNLINLIKFIQNITIIKIYRIFCPDNLV